MTLKIKGAQYFGLLRGYVHCLDEIAVLTLGNKEEIEAHYRFETVRLITNPSALAITFDVDFVIVYINLPLKMLYCSNVLLGCPCTTQLS